MNPTSIHPLARMMGLAGIALALGGAAYAAIPRDILERPDRWFRGDQARTIATNLLSWQDARGAWPKNKDLARAPYNGDRQKLRGTFDNKSTTDELRFLGRFAAATGDADVRRAVTKGIDHILDAQYPHGGFPQFHPPGNDYHRHVTFNDHTMVRLLEFLRETAEVDHWSWLDRSRRARCTEAFHKGIGCILRCQIRVNGQLTVWCAQHDAETLAPTAGRAYELASLSGSESAAILILLMSLNQPNEAVKDSVHAGVAWFERAALGGLRIDHVNGERILVNDSTAGPLWARFYDIETGNPLFSDRDGAKRWNYMDVSRERRNGYAWFGNWGRSVVERYREWPHRKRR